MKPLALGALLGVLWLTIGLPVAATTSFWEVVAQPVTVAFAAGVLARPHLTRWRWSR